MAVYDIIPDADFTGDDVRDTLNASGGSVGDDFFDYFSTDANINHWSKYKPVRYPADFPAKNAYWKAEDGNCGFTPKNTTAYSSIPSLMDGNMNGWTYNLPRGVNSYRNEPYRKDDFRGYAPKAVPMVSDFFVPSKMSNQFTSASFDAIAVVAPDGGNSITLGDLSLSSYYAGVIVSDSSGTIKKAVIGDSLSGGAFHVEVPCYDLSAGTYTCYPMISSNPATGMSGEKYYTLPNVQSKQITIVTSNFVIAVLAERVTTGSMAISYKITISNTSTAATWTNNAYKLRFFNKKYEDPLTQGESSGTLRDPIQVAANEDTVISGFIDVSTTLWNETSFVLWVSFNSGTHISSGAITSNTQQ